MKKEGPWALYFSFTTSRYRLAAMRAPSAALFSTSWMLAARELPPVSSRTRASSYRQAAMRAPSAALFSTS